MNLLDRDDRNAYQHVILRHFEIYDENELSNHLFASDTPEYRLHCGITSDTPRDSQGVGCKGKPPRLVTIEQDENTRPVAPKDCSHDKYWEPINVEPNKIIPDSREATPRRTDLSQNVTLAPAREFIVDRGACFSHRETSGNRQFSIADPPRCRKSLRTLHCKWNRNGQPRSGRLCPRSRHSCMGTDSR